METYTKQLNFMEEKQGRKGIFAWIFSTDHKRIGILYLFSITFFFLVGGILGGLMRLELVAPGQTIMNAQTYNGLFTVHGIIMIFLVVIPGLGAVFGNFFLPIMIGARDVAFPKINLLSWWIYVTGAILALYSQCFCRFCLGFFIYSHGTEFYCYHTPHAGSGNDLVPNAAISLVALCYCMDSGFGNPYRRYHIDDDCGGTVVPDRFF
jgi:hypothetical protein